MNKSSYISKMAFLVQAKNNRRYLSKIFDRFWIIIVFCANLNVFESIGSLLLFAKEDATLRGKNSRLDCREILTFVILGNAYHIGNG
jgi:hypothetical protein